MDRGIYSPYKAVKFQGRIRALMRHNMIPPTQIQIDLTSRCNHECGHCYYRFYNVNGDFPVERVYRLLNEIESLGVVVQFTGGGEPLLYPEFYNVIEKVIEKKIGFALVTNGVLADIDKIDLLTKADWIRVSLDAANPVVYANVHGCEDGDFYKAQSFLHRLVNKKAESQTIVGVSFMVTPSNFSQIVEATKLARDIGVDNIRITLAYLSAGIKLFSGVLSQIEELVKQAQEMKTETFDVINLVPYAMTNLQMHDKGYAHCYYQQFTAVIGADMELYPCCTLKYSEHKMGNLADNSFDKVWHSDARKAWLKSDHLRSVCQKNPCGMDKKNTFIEYLAMKNPLCVDYI